MVKRLPQNLETSGWMNHTELERVPLILIFLVLKPPNITCVLMAASSTILWTHPVLSVPDVLTPTLLVFLRLIAFCLVLLLNCILFLPHNVIYCIHFSGPDGSNLTPKFGLNAETDNAT